MLVVYMMVRQLGVEIEVKNKIGIGTKMQADICKCYNFID